MAQVGDVIEFGQEIPDDVLEMIDVDAHRDNFWQRRKDGWTYLQGRDDPDPHQGDLGMLERRDYFPMTVSKVRGPGPDPVHYRPTGDEKTACDIEAWTPGQPATEVWPEVTCTACLGAVVPAAEPIEFPDLHSHIHHFGDMAARLQLMALVKQRDEARAAVTSSLNASQPTQACNTEGLPLWIHLCGEVDAFPSLKAFDRVPFEGGCDRCDSGYPQPGDWRPLLVTGPHRAAGPLKPAGPVVHTLPRISTGTVALIGGRTGDRYEWRGEEWSSPTWCGHLHELLHYEGSVTEVPWEPRRWGKLDGPPDELTKVEVNGRTWTRSKYKPTGRWEDGSGARATFCQLRTQGEVVEVFE